MNSYRLKRELWVPRPLPEVFAFFAKPENLQELTPPWLGFRILSPSPVHMGRGAVIEYALRVRGLPLHWRTEIEKWDPPFEFVDIQAKGPYRLWRHTHWFSPDGKGTRIGDAVEYSLPFGAIGRLVNRLQVGKDVARIFDYRASRVRELFG